MVPDLRVLPDGEFDRLLADAPVDIRGDLLAPLLDLWNQLKEGGAAIKVDSTLTMQQLEKAGFRDAVPGPGRLLRAFRFDPAERLQEGRRSCGI